jgi:hypothetical protein
MNTPAPFEVTSEALEVVASLLRQHPEMQAALMLTPSFEQLDEQGAVEARFEREHFMMGYDSPDKFLQWPDVELCGQRVPVAPDALERLKGRTLAIQAHDIIYIAGGKETREFLVAA